MYKPFLSIVVPVFNEESVIDHFYAELIKTLEVISKTYEIIYIDDGSTDKTFKKIKQLNSKDPNIFCISTLL